MSVENYVEILRSDKANLIYICNTKCASNSILNFLIELSGLDPSDQPYEELHGRLGSRLQIFLDHGLEIKRIPAKELGTYRTQYQNHIFFSFVRNPYSRTLSAYRSKLHRMVRKHMPLLHLKLKLKQFWLGLFKGKKAARQVCIQHRNASFPPEQLIRKLLQVGPSFDRHFASQSDVIGFNSNYFDFIGKLESFESDLVKLLSLRATTQPQEQPNPALRLRLLNSSKTPSQGDQLNQEMIALINVIYKQDFENFGYPMLG